MVSKLAQVSSGKKEIMLINILRSLSLHTANQYQIDFGRLLAHLFTIIESCFFEDGKLSMGIGIGGIG